MSTTDPPREIHVDCPDWETLQGIHAVIPVKVSWPELHLTSDQHLANSIAFLNGEPRPFPDHSIFKVVIKRPRP